MKKVLDTVCKRFTGWIVRPMISKSFLVVLFCLCCLGTTPLWGQTNPEAQKSGDTKSNDDPANNLAAGPEDLPEQTTNAESKNAKSSGTENCSVKSNESKHSESQNDLFDQVKKYISGDPNEKNGLFPNVANSSSKILLYMPESKRDQAFFEELKKMVKAIYPTSFVECQDCGITMRVDTKKDGSIETMITQGIEDPKFRKKKTNYDYFLSVVLSLKTSVAGASRSPLLWNVPVQQVDRFITVKSYKKEESDKEEECEIQQFVLKGKSSLGSRPTQEKYYLGFLTLPIKVNNPESGTDDTFDHNALMLSLEEHVGLWSPFDSWYGSGQAFWGGEFGVFGGDLPFFGDMNSHLTREERAGDIGGLLLHFHFGARTGWHYLSNRVDIALQGGPVFVFLPVVGHPYHPLGVDFGVKVNKFSFKMKLWSGSGGQLNDTDEELQGATAFLLSWMF